MSEKEDRHLTGGSNWEERHRREHGEYQLEESEAEAEVAQTRAEEQKQRMAQRKRYARYFVLGAFGWVMLTFLVLLFNGFGWWGFELSDTLLMVMLGTGTVNVLAPAYLVARFLFGGTDE